MDAYILRQDCFIETMRFASAPPEADPSLQNLVSRERAWLHNWTHMAGFNQQARLRLDSSGIRCQNEVSPPKQVLHVIK